MALNKIQCANGRLTLYGEHVLYHQDGVEFVLEGDQIPGFLKGSKKGNLFISTQKVIFAPTSSSNYGSFSMNFHSIRNVEVKQPMFGANFIKGDVISEPDGGWQGRGIFKATFSSGGAIEFSEHFRRAVTAARRAPPPQPAGHPAGMMNGGGYPGPYYNAGPGYYPPPPPGPGGYAPYPPAAPYPHAPVGGMGQPPPYHIHENPPPYPGQYPMQTGPYPSQAAPSAPPSEAEGAKAREAYSSGQNVFVPAPQYPPPYPQPTYGANDKKNV